MRLRLGDMEQSTIFTMIRRLKHGTSRRLVEWLHLDLNGAFAGKPVNAEAVEGIPLL